MQDGRIFYRLPLSPDRVNTREWRIRRKACPTFGLVSACCRGLYSLGQAVGRRSRAEPGGNIRIDMDQHFYFTLTSLAYGISLGCYVAFLNTGRAVLGTCGTVLLFLGLVAHYFALLESSRGLHTVPYHDLYGSMSLFGWLLALTYLGLELYHRQKFSWGFCTPFYIGIFFDCACGAGE